MTIEDRLALIENQLKQVQQRLDAIDDEASAKQRRILWSLFGDSLCRGNPELAAKLFFEDN